MWQVKLQESSVEFANNAFHCLQYHHLTGRTCLQCCCAWKSTISKQEIPCWYYTALHSLLSGVILSYSWISAYAYTFYFHILCLLCITQLSYSSVSETITEYEIVHPIVSFGNQYTPEVSPPSCSGLCIISIICFLIVGTC